MKLLSWIMWESLKCHHKSTHKRDRERLDIHIEKMTWPWRQIAVIWPQTQGIYSLTVLEARSLKSVSLGQNQDICRVTFRLTSGGISSSSLASGGSKHFFSAAEWQQSLPPSSHKLLFCVFSLMCVSCLFSLMHVFFLMCMSSPSRVSLLPHISVFSLMYVSPPSYLCLLPHVCLFPHVCVSSLICESCVFSLMCVSSPSCVCLLPHVCVSLLFS